MENLLCQNYALYCACMYMHVEHVNDLGPSNLKKYPLVCFFIHVIFLVDILTIIAM